MRLRSIAFALLIALGLMLLASASALANGGDEAEQALSYSPLALVPAGLAVLAVGYVMFRILRGR